MWSVLESLLRDAKYVQCNEPTSIFTAKVKQVVHARDWHTNPTAHLAMLHVNGKAKSLSKGQWLWCPIAALPQPLLSKSDLRIAACVATTWFRLLSSEVPGTIMVH